MASCRVCKEDIREGAEKCIHCDSYQHGPRRFFSFSALVLSLIVALVSVVTAAVPVFRSLVPGHAKVTYEILSCDRSEVRVVAVNGGNALAAVRGGQYEYKKGDEEKPRNFELLVKGSRPVIGPQKHAEFQLVRDENIGPLPGGNTCKHKVTLILSSPGASLDEGGTPFAQCPCT